MIALILRTLSAASRAHEADSSLHELQDGHRSCITLSGTQLDNPRVAPWTILVFWGDGFEEFLQGAVAPRLLRALEYGAVRGGMRVLDIGFGRGELAVKCAEAGCDVWL